MPQLSPMMQTLMFMVLWMSFFSIYFNNSIFSKKTMMKKKKTMTKW